MTAARRTAVVLALLAALGSVGTSTASARCPSVADPADVLATSSRLQGVVAALARLDLAVTVVVHEGALPPTPPVCGEEEQAVSVELDAPPSTARVTTSAVPGELAQRVEHEIQGRLQTNPSDPASAVARGLELLWQEEDVRDAQTSSDRSVLSAGEVRPDTAGGPVAVAPTAAKFSDRLSVLLHRVLTALVGGAALTAVIAAGVGARRRRRATRELRRNAQLSRAELAERYVDLEARVAMIVTATDRAAREMDPASAADFVLAVADRKALLDDAAQRAGDLLLSTASSIRAAPPDHARDVADRCGAALADLDAAVATLDASLRQIEQASMPAQPSRCTHVAADQSRTTGWGYSADRF